MTSRQSLVDVLVWSVLVKCSAHRTRDFESYRHSTFGEDAGGGLVHVPSPVSAPAHSHMINKELWYPPPCTGTTPPRANRNMDVRLQPRIFTSSTPVSWNDGPQISVSYQSNKRPVHTRHAPRYPFSCNAIHGTVCTRYRIPEPTSLQQMIYGNQPPSNIADFAVWAWHPVAVGTLRLSVSHVRMRSEHYQMGDDIKYQCYTLTADDMADG